MNSDEPMNFYFFQSVLTIRVPYCSFQVNSILCYVAKLLEYETDEQLEELCDKTVWHFDRKYKKVGVAFEIFKKAVS